MTSLAKKVGGPKALAGLTIAGGYVVGRLTEAGAKTLFRASRSGAKEEAKDPGQGRVFDVISAGEDDHGLKLRVGDQYRVLERDEEAILIEVLEAQDNPHFTSASFLASVSSFIGDSASEVK